MSSGECTHVVSKVKGCAWRRFMAVCGFKCAGHASARPSQIAVGGSRELEFLRFLLRPLHHLSVCAHTVPIPCIPCALSEAGFQERGTLIELSFYGLPGVSV